MSVEVGGTWPFVGRDKELRTVAGVLGTPAAGGLHLAGPAGVGKSRLATECAAIAARAGFRCARVLATRSASGIPLGALAPLLPPEWGRTLLSGQPGRLPPQAQPSRQASRATTASPSMPSGDSFGPVANTIGSGDRPLFLVVDDAHLLDDASAAVVRQLAGPDRAFVVVTTRTGSAAPEPLRSMWTDGTVCRLEITPLTRSDIEGLLSTVLAGPVDGASRHALWVASQGNVLYLRELVLGALDSGILARDDGLWRLVRPLGLPPRLIELVEARLAELRPGERNLLELLALGEPLGWEMLGRLTDPATVEQVAARGLAATVESGRTKQVRLAHPLHGEALRQQLTTLARTALNRRLADASTDLPDPSDDDLLRAAVWRLDGGGDVVPAPMLAAARTAYFAHEHTLAERLARAAIDAGAGAAGGLLLAQVLGGLGRHEERVTALREAEHGADNDQQRAMIVMERALALFWALGRGVDADHDLAAATRAMPPGPWRDEVTAQQATLALLRGDMHQAIGAAMSILESATPGDRAVVKAAVAAAPALAVAGRFSEAVAVSDRGRAVHDALGDQEVMSDPGMHLVAHGLALAEAGLFGRAESLLSAAYDEALARSARVGQAWCAMLRGRTALATGQLVTAAHLFTEAVGLYTELGHPGPRRWCLAGKVLAHTWRGELSAAAQTADELASSPTTAMVMMEPEVVRARGWAELMRGNVERARQLLVEAAELAERGGAYALAASMWHDLARVGAAGPAHEALTRLSDGRLIEGDLLRVRTRFATGIVSADADLLAAVAVEFEAMGALLFAAEAAAESSAAYRQTRSARAADRLAQRAVSLTARCQGAATPSLDLAGALAVLTSREREVARMAVQGLSSKAIAARFEVSVRTVDSHLLRIYAKLGITGRSELGGVFAPVTSGAGGATPSEVA